MIASSLDELKQMLQQQMTKAMDIAATKALADLYEQTGDFYSGGEPNLYERTGSLGDTPRTTAVSSSGDTASFTAYLDSSGGYSTGKRPSMKEVLILADTGSYPGLNPAVGKTGFWERAEENIKKDVVDIMKSFFG